VKVKWLTTVAGQTYGKPNGIKRGEVDDLPDEEARRMIKAGLAQANWKEEPGPPFQPSEGSPALETIGTRKVWAGWKA
jgi:alkylation response protein AidB-like acyl-CoA dehydrogenase